MKISISMELSLTREAKKQNQPTHCESRVRWGDDEMYAKIAERLNAYKSKLSKSSSDKTS